MEYKALNKVFNNICILPCFFHFISNIVKKLPDLKSKNKNKKKIALDLLANFKLLCFVKRETITEFFNKIKNKYNNNYSSFLKKFEKTYFKSNPFNGLYWNYNPALINNLDNSIMFYTNNICESYNRTLKFDL